MKTITYAHYFSLIALFMIGVINQTTATTFQSKPGPSTGQDAYLASGAPNSNYENHPEFAGDGWTCSGNPCFGRGVLFFNLNSIPQNSFIQSASLSLHANPAPSNGNGISMQGFNESVLQRITSSWAENTVTWNNAPIATSVHQVTLLQSTTQFQDYLNIDVKALVQDMVNNPSTSFGFLLKLANETYYNTMIFASSDYPDSLLWPEIHIEYLPTACLDLVINSLHGSDAFLASGAPAVNYGSHPELSASAWTCGGSPCYSRGLFDFDWSSIPPNAQIVSALLDLHYNPNPQNGNGIAMQGANAAWIRRVTSTWNENTIDWNTEPASTIQNQAELTESVSSNQNYLNIDVTNLVLDMRANPSTSYGFELILQNEVYYASMIFASSDYPDSTLTPKLKICYSTSIGIDEIENIKGDIGLYPIPFNDELNVRFDVIKKSKVDYRISNVLGETVYRNSLGTLGPQQYDIVIKGNLDQLPSGFYTLEMFFGDQKISKKIIK